MGKAKSDYRRQKKKEAREAKDKQKKEKNSRHFAPNEEEAIAANKQGLSDYREASKSAFQNVVYRTNVVETAIRNEELDEELKSLGAAPEDVKYHQVEYISNGSDDDEDDEDDLKLRGGFSAKEANKQVSHAPLSIKTSTSGLPKELIRDQYRVLNSGGDHKKIVALVYLDANGYIFLIHLMNIIPDQVLKARNLLATKLGSLNNYWVKGCSFSGRPNAVAMKCRLVGNRDVRSSLYAETSCDRVQMDEIRIACKSTGQSSRIHYKNIRKKEEIHDVWQRDRARCVSIQKITRQHCILG